MINVIGWIQTLDFLFYLFVFVTGLCLGSFLNSWMWRTRDNTRITNGRSICIHCRRQLRWWENIPLFSYIFLGGRCRTCHKKIPLHYTVVELGTALALVVIFHYHVNSLGGQDLFSEWHVLRDVFFLTILIITFVYDYLYEEVLIRMTTAGILIGFLINLLTLHYSGFSMFLGMFVAAGFFLLQYLISRGRWIGGGDIWIGAMMGVWLGWPLVLVALFLAYIFGAAVSVVLLLVKKKKMGAQLPFGVFLSVATFFTIYYGTDVLSWYLNLLK